MNYLQDFFQIPVPSTEQIKRFKSHLVTVHSWYKHLSLNKGGRFVVFLKKDLNSSYPNQHPRLPYGNTARGYKQAFGHLAYRYCIDHVWYEDYDTTIINGKLTQLTQTEMPLALMEACSFTLYPFCHDEFYEAIGFWENDFTKIKNEDDHLHAAHLLQVQEKYVRTTEYWGQMSEAEKELVLAIEDNLEMNNSSTNQASKDVINYFKVEQELNALLEYLQKQELQKVEKALSQLLFLRINGFSIN